MFHDLESTRKRGSQTERFEVDGANAARDYLKSAQPPPSDIDLVWTSNGRRRAWEPHTHGQMRG
jgi:hypothetical protein